MLLSTAASALMYTGEFKVSDQVLKYKMSWKIWNGCLSVNSCGKLHPPVDSRVECTYDQGCHYDLSSPHYSKPASLWMNSINNRQFHW